MDIEAEIKEIEDLIKLRKSKTKNNIEFDSCIVGTKALNTLLEAYKEERSRNFLEYQCKKCTNKDLCKNNQWCITMDRIPGICDNFRDARDVPKDKIKAIIKDLEEFDENFYDNKTLKLAFKNSLQELLKENKK